MIIIHDARVTYWDLKLPVPIDLAVTLGWWSHFQHARREGSHGRIRKWWLEKIVGRRAVLGSVRIHYWFWVGVVCSFRVGPQKVLAIGKGGDRPVPSVAPDAIQKDLIAIFSQRKVLAGIDARGVDVHVNPVTKRVSDESVVSHSKCHTGGNPFVGGSIGDNPLELHDIGNKAVCRLAPGAVR